MFSIFDLFTTVIINFHMSSYLYISNTWFALPLLVPYVDSLNQHWEMWIVISMYQQENRWQSVLAIHTDVRPLQIKLELTWVLRCKLAPSTPIKSFDLLCLLTSFSPILIQLCISIRWKQNLALMRHHPALHTNTFKCFCRVTLKC